MSTCEWCGGELVEVDNLMRREVRHKRGVICSGEPSAEEKERRRQAIAQLQGHVFANPAKGKR